MPGLASKTHVQTQGQGHESMNRCPKPIAALTAHVLLVTTCATVNAVFSGHEHVYESSSRKTAFTTLF